VVKNIRSVPLTLCEKILSYEERLTQKIKQLEEELKEIILLQIES
jgi:hypothetical protein